MTYLNFSKAFDTVSHDILLSKPGKCAQEDTSIRWDCSWLPNWPLEGIHGSLLNCKDLSSGVCRVSPVPSQSTFSLPSWILDWRACSLNVLSREGLQAHRRRG